jgi:KDO2-lipid IV(A) lauroyltransferase
MSPASWSARLKNWTQAERLSLALRRIAEYAALRLWTLIVGCFPINANLRTARLMGRIWWLVMRRHRERALEHLRAALGDVYDEAGLQRIAKRSFEHFAQLYLVELVQAPRIVNEWSWARYCELDQLGPAVQAQLAGRGCLLLTGHFGNYELLGYAVSRFGLPITAVMRPLDNPLLSELLERSRRAGGLTLLAKKGVTEAAQQVVDRGESLAFIADQDAGKKGAFVDFFGRKASTYKSIGLLALAKRVPVVVGCAARTRAGFRYRLWIERVIEPAEWDARPDPLLWITQEYTHALERAIRRYPEQYLWIHRRWKHRPRDERPAARRLPPDERKTHPSRALLSEGVRPRE